MSGAGRKHRAKHMTRQYLDAGGWLGPSEEDSLAVCMESPHGQHVRVLVLCLSSQLPPDTDAAATADAKTKGPSPTTERTDGDAELDDRRLTKQLVFLPGKFHKVIWLSIKDVVVVADGSVRLKPSPEQLANFLKLPENAEYKELIARAQQLVLDGRLAMERAPLHSKLTTTTTSALPTEQQRQHEQFHEAEAAGGDDSDDDSLSKWVNPNRANIRHRMQYFHLAESEGDGNEDEEEEEEEVDGNAQVC